MSLHKKNSLVKSHLIVLGFWFFVLFVIIHGLNFKKLANSMSYSLLVLVGGAICGILIWFILNSARRNFLLEESGAHKVRKANSTLGPLPKGRAPKRGKVNEVRLMTRFKGWSQYQAKHPAHAKAFRAVLAVMEAQPKLPASPVPGGHGDASLIDHSFNVVDTMLEMAPKWVYQGHKNKKGDVSFPLLDSTKVEFRFDKDDPLPILAALAHDIGKITCYQLNSDGTVTEVKKHHDVEGARLLRCIPEVMDLPWEDQMALLIACEYYHHIGSLPYSTWINDRARALIELLIAADIATGQREGGIIIGEYENADIIVQNNKNALSDNKIQQPSQALADPQETSDADATAHQSTINSAPQATPAPAPAVAPATSAGADTENDLQAQVYDLAYTILLQPGRVNGGNTRERIAWKHGQWLYINDFKLRSAVASKTNDKSYEVSKRGQMHEFTLTLMEVLSQRGQLLQEFEGKTYSAKRAIFNTRSSITNKKTKSTDMIETSFVIVAKAKAFPGLENAADCKNAPQVTGCAWGESAAINKKQTAKATEEKENSLHNTHETQSVAAIVYEASEQPATKAEDSQKEEGIEDDDLPLLPPLQSWEQEPQPSGEGDHGSAENGKAGTAVAMASDIDDSDLPFAFGPEDAKVTTQGQEQTDEGQQGALEATAAPSAELPEPEPEIPDQTMGILREIVQTVSAPYSIKKVSGEDYYFFEEDILLEIYPGLDLSNPALVRKEGGKSGVRYIGLKVEK